MRGIAAWACAKNLTQFRRRSSVSYIYQIRGAALVLRTYWAYAIILCCLGSPALAAGIQLLDSDPGLAGAIWYPCAGEPKHVALGGLAVAEDFGLMGVKDCPVTGAKLPLIIVSHGRTGWFGANHDTAEALADASFVVAAINHPATTATTHRCTTTYPSGRRVRWIWFVCSISCCTTGKTNRLSIPPGSVSSVFPRAAIPAWC
jgi:hypothetical protein